MTRLQLSREARRMLWRFNVDIAAYAHPGWLEPLAGTARRRLLPRSYLQSQRLIEQQQLGLLGMDMLATEIGRFVLLDASDLKKLTCLAAALGIADQLKLLVSGKAAGDCVRILGREVADLALKLANDPIAQEFNGLLADAANTALPKRLLQIQRSLLMALCDSAPRTAAQRMRLRFRPGYFDRSIPINGPASLAPALLEVASYANLSEQAKCILRY